MAWFTRRHRRSRETMKQKKRKSPINSRQITLFLLALISVSFMKGNPSRKKSSAILKRCRSQCEKSLATASSQLALSAIGSLILVRNELKQNKSNGNQDDHNAQIFPPQTSQPNRLSPLIIALIKSVDEDFHRNHSTLSNFKRKTKPKSGSSHNEMRKSGRMEALNKEWQDTLRWIVGWEVTGTSEYNRKKRNYYKKRRDMARNARAESFSMVENCVNICFDRHANRTNQYCVLGTDRWRLVGGGGAFEKLLFTSFFWISGHGFVDAIVSSLLSMHDSDTWIVFLCKVAFSFFFFNCVYFIIQFWSDRQRKNPPVWLAEEMDVRYYYPSKSEQRNKKTSAKKGNKKKMNHQIVADEIATGNSCNLTYTTASFQFNAQYESKHSKTSSHLQMNISQEAYFESKDAQTEFKLCKKKRKEKNRNLIPTPEKEPILRPNDEFTGSKTPTKKNHLSAKQALKNQKDKASFYTPELSEQASSETSKKPFVPTTRVHNLQNVVASSKVSSSYDSNLLSKENRESESCLSVNTKKNKQGQQFLSSEQSSVSHKKPIVRYPLKNHSLPVPTDKQREEAFHRLREYQSAQIAKIIERRKMSKCEKVFVSSGALNADPRKEQHPFFVERPLHSRDSFAFRRTFDCPQDEYEDVSCSSDDFLSGDGLLLSNMLDDDDEDCSIIEPQRRLSAFSEESSRKYLSSCTSNSSDAWGTGIGPLVNLSLQVPKGETTSLVSLEQLKISSEDHEYEIWSQTSSTAATSTTTSWVSLY